jgi:hypothetical protein
MSPYPQHQLADARIISRRPGCGQDNLKGAAAYPMKAEYAE